MASIIWQTIFVLLVCELVVTLILVVPVPRKIRNFIARECFQWNIGDRLQKPIKFIGVALCLALVESYVTHQRILSRIEEEIQAGVASPARHHYVDHRFYPNLHDKERKYKSERNMYLAGFALTLLFVIGRITTLLVESVELHDETDRLEKANKEQANGNEGTATGAATVATTTTIKDEQAKKAD
jgi:hypothetical protein